MIRDPRPQTHRPDQTSQPDRLREILTVFMVTGGIYVLG